MTSPRHLSLFLILGLFWGISPSLYRHWGVLGMPVTHVIVLTGIGVAARPGADLPAARHRLDRAASGCSSSGWAAPC